MIQVVKKPLKTNGTIAPKFKPYSFQS